MSVEQATEHTSDVDMDQIRINNDGNEHVASPAPSGRTYDDIHQWRQNASISYVQRSVTEPTQLSSRTNTSTEALNKHSGTGTIPSYPRKSSFRRTSLPTDFTKPEPQLTNPDSSRSDSHLPFARKSSLRSDKQASNLAETIFSPPSIASQRRPRAPNLQSTQALTSSQHTLRKIRSRRSIDAYVAKDPFRPIAGHNKQHGRDVQNFDQIGLPDDTETFERDEHLHVYRRRRQSQSSHRSSSSLGTQDRAPMNRIIQDGQGYPPSMPKFTQSRISLLTGPLNVDPDGWSFAGESDYDDDESGPSKYHPFYASNAEDSESNDDPQTPVYHRSDTEIATQQSEPQYRTLAESVLNVLTSVFRSQPEGPRESTYGELEYEAHAFNFPYGSPQPSRPARNRHHRTIFSASSSDTADESMGETAFRFLVTTLPSQIYLYILFRLPSLYFSRVARIFEEAEMTLPELKKMAIETALYVQSRTNLSAFELEEAPPQYDRLKTTWRAFIDSILREWETFNIVSALLLSAILTILQIESAARDPITRYTALLSMICALISLLFGCVYIVRFGNMRKTYKAAEWALEAQKTNTIIWWNVWVLLAMPAIWLTWAIISYIACIMSFIWLTTPQSDDPTVILSENKVVAARIAITGVLGLGLLYGMLILNTLSFYGDAMDRVWKSRIEGWIAEKTERQHSAPSEANRRTSRTWRASSRSSLNDDGSTYSGYDTLGRSSQSGSNFRRHSNSHYYDTPTERSDSLFIPPSRPGSVVSESSPESSRLFSNTLHNALPPLEGGFSTSIIPSATNASASEIIPVDSDGPRQVRFSSKLTVHPPVFTASSSSSLAPASLDELSSAASTEFTNLPSTYVLPGSPYNSSASGSDVEEGQFDDAPTPPLTLPLHDLLMGNY